MLQTPKYFSLLLAYTCLFHFKKSFGILYLLNKIEDRKQFI